MITQVWGTLGSSKIIFDKTDGNIWKVTVPFMESGEYIVALYAFIGKFSFGELLI